MFSPINVKHYCFNVIEAIRILSLCTGYSARSRPVFSWKMSLRISSASSDSPHSIRNFGLSGKKNSHNPNSKLIENDLIGKSNEFLHRCGSFIVYLGIAQIATNKFQL